MNITLAQPLSINHQQTNLRPVSLLRFALPLLLFLLASGFEFWEHWVKTKTLFLNSGGLLEVIIFGILGPLSVFTTLTYVNHLVYELETSRSQAQSLNQNLEKLVAERTGALARSNEQLQQANVRLQELDQMKSDFVSMVSHELRAPLATMNGGLEVARPYLVDLPIKAQRVFELLTNETKRLTQFVQTMLDISQLETGRLRLICGPVSVKPLLNRAADIIFGPDQEERIQWRLPADLPPVWADETYLDQTIRNLLRNAQKYAPAPLPIELSAVVYDHTLQIWVTDYGPGIPKSEQDHIFDRFYRLPRQSERETSGWGLGLYFARMLTAAQSGSLTLQSPVFADTAMPGTRFIVTLPIAEEEPADGELVTD